MRTIYLSVLIIVINGGCAHPRPSDEVWGEEATISPGWSVIKRAAVDAATDPFTWIPALSAAALQIGGADEDIADSVRRNTPLFGSAKTAEDVSDALRVATIGIYAGLGLAAPGPEDSSKWWQTKGKGFLVGGATLGATVGLTEGLKSITGRTRPNGEDDRSLPSGHVSTTAAAARLAADTLDYYEISHGARIAANTGLVALTTITAWARIEAGAHFPADVLLGAALGNFVAKFTTAAFLHPMIGSRVMLTMEPLPKGGTVTFHMNF